MNITNYNDPEEIKPKSDDVFNLAGTDRDESKKYSLGYFNDSIESTIEITAVIDKLEEEGYYDDEEDYDDYHLWEDKYLLNSDRASIGAGNSKRKVPGWIYAFVMLIGLAVVGVSGYWIVSEYVNPTAAQVAPIPDDEDLFDTNSTVTYTGPSRHEIDWAAEFDKIDYEDPSNLGGVVIPSLDMYSEIIATDAEQGSLILPDAPKGTWYQQTAEIGAEQGNTILAGHVNYRDDGAFSPWAHLHESDRGMLIGVRDHDGVIHIYEATDMNIYSRQSVPIEYFRTDGEHRIHLITCSGEIQEDPEDLAGRYFEHNLIVSGELVETLDENS